MNKPKPVAKPKKATPVAPATPATPTTPALLGDIRSLIDEARRVATVAVNGSMNAALLVVQMLAISDQALAAKLADHRREMAGPA